MKKIVYLHGMESSSGGKKVEFLKTQGEVFAPAMDYYDSFDIRRIQNEIFYLKPDVIIGSSMGGYLAHNLASFIKTDVILFNPAVHSRKIEFPVITGEKEHKVKGFCVLGLEDKVINPEPTIGMLKDEELIFIGVEEMAHRVPFEVFVDIYNKYLENELSL